MTLTSSRTRSATSRTRRNSFFNRSRSLFLERLEQRTLLAAVITVNSADDTDTRDTVLTLREALEVNNRTLAVSALTASEQGQVNGTPSSADADTIAFNIPGSGVHTITPTTALGQLPPIAEPVTIDGYLQPGASKNTNGPGLADNAVLVVEISGSIIGNNGNGINVNSTASGTTLRGLVIDNGWSAGILVSAPNTAVEGCFIGTD